jgi:Zn finger protein HypA/HybF involved in hydrogenase expression
MYFCHECKHVFDDPDTESDGYEAYEFWGQRGHRERVKYLCPHCQSEDVDDYNPRRHEAVNLEVEEEDAER